MCKNTNIKGQIGFTLIEMSIVLVIVSILIGTGLSISLVQMENSRIASTKTKQETIKLSLLNFIARNSRMPCPAIGTLALGTANYGVEAINPGVCTGVAGFGGGVTRNVRGIVPWVSLGLPEETSLDGYGRRFTYQILRTETATAASPGLQGNITILDAAGGNQINPQHPAIAALISHGNNGRGAYLPGSGRRMAVPPVADADERENTDNDFELVQKQYADTATNPFDDIVLWLEPGDLITQLSLQGRIQSPEYLVNTRFKIIRDTLLGYIVADSVDPDAGGARTVARRLPFADSKGTPDGSENGALNGVIAWDTIAITEEEATDPWGNYIRYSVDTDLVNNGVTNLDPSSPAPYTLSSDGPDGIQGNSDDVVLSVDVNNLRGSLTAATIMLDPNY